MVASPLKTTLEKTLHSGKIERQEIEVGTHTTICSRTTITTSCCPPCSKTDHVKKSGHRLFHLLANF